MGDNFYRSKDPTNRIKALKEEATKENLAKLNNKIHTNTKYMHTCREDRLCNRVFSQLWDRRNLDLGLGHIAHHRISLINLYVPNFVEIGKTVCGRTAVC